MYMLIIGKTLEENLMSSIMKRTSALNGKLKTSFRLMLMAVSMNIVANFLMVGKSKNIILSTIKCMLAVKVSLARNPIALIITQSKIRGKALISSSRFFLKIEGLLSSRLKSISRSS